MYMTCASVCSRMCIQRLHIKNYMYTCLSMNLLIHLYVHVHVRLLEKAHVQSTSTYLNKHTQCHLLTIQYEIRVITCKYGT